MFDHAVEEKFLHPGNRALVIAGKNPSEMLDCLANYKVPHHKKTVDHSWHFLRCLLELAYAHAHLQESDRYLARLTQ